MAAPEGQFALATRVFMTDTQRRQLATLLRAQQRDLPDLLTHLLAEFLAAQPASDPAAPLEPAAETSALPSTPPNLDALIAHHRVELSRLRERAARSDGPPPVWLTTYMEDLEREVAQLAAQQRMRTAGA